MEILNNEPKIGWLTHLFAKIGLDLRLFYIAVPRIKGDLIGEPAHLAAAIFAIVCEAISTASASVGINILLLATLLRAPALVPSWKQMLSQTWFKLLLLWIAWMAISIAWSPDVPKGFDQFLMLKYFIWIPILCPLYKQWRWLLAGILLSAFILQCVQVAGAVGITYHGQNLTRGIRHPTTVGMWDAITLSCWMFLAVTLTWQKILFCIPLAVLSAAGFIQAGQRATLVGILVEIIIANIVLVFAVCGSLRRAALRVVLAIVVIGGVYFFIGGELTVKLKRVYNEATKNLIMVDMNAQTGDPSKIIYEERLAMWRMALIAWRTHPFTGVGNGGYVNATAHINNVKNPNFDVHFHGHPHSTYIMILTENGLVGLILFLAWVGAFFVRAFKGVQLDSIRVVVFGAAVIWFSAAAVDSFHRNESFLSLGVIMMAMAAMPVVKLTDTFRSVFRDSCESHK